VTETAFDPAQTARGIIAGARTASLATLDRTGAPFASLVTVAPIGAGALVMLISALAYHTQNLKRDPRASLLLVAPGGEGGDPLAGARLTLQGRADVPEPDESHAQAFLARHPDAGFYAGFRDFAFWRFAPASGHLVAGFGRIADLDEAALKGT